MDYRNLLNSVGAPNSFYGVRNFDIDTSAFSSNNPYTEQMRLARNKTDYKRLQTQAIQWEANIAKNNIDLENQRALRDEEREYNDYSSQVSRMRKAGLNPDILLSNGAGSGAGSGGSVSAPQMSDTDLTDLSTPMETAQTVSGVMSGVGSLVSSVVGSASGIVDMVSTISLLGGNVRKTNAEATKAEADASVANKQSVLRTVGDSVDLASTLASLYPVSQNEDGTPIIPTLEDVNGFLGKFGIDGASNIGPIMHDIMKNPSSKALYNKLIDAGNREEARNLSRGFDFYRSLENLQASLELTSLQSSNYIASFDKNLNQLLSMSSVAQQTVSNMELEQSVIESGLRNQQVDAEFLAVRLRHDFDSFNACLAQNAEVVKDLRQRLKDVEDNPDVAGTTEGLYLIRNLRSQIMQVETAMSGDIRGFLDVLQSANSTSYMTDSLGLSTPDAQMKHNRNGKPTDPNVKLKDGFLNGNRGVINFHNFMVSNYLEDPGSWYERASVVINGLITGATAGLGMYYGFRGSKGIKTTNRTVIKEPLVGRKGTMTNYFEEVRNIQ